MRPRSTDPQTGRGPDTGPHTGEQGVSPDRDTAGRSGADTGAGSLPKTGMADADLDPATGGLGDTGTAGSASPSRSRTRTAVYGTDTEPFVGGRGGTKANRILPGHTHHTLRGVSPGKAGIVPGAPPRDWTHPGTVSRPGMYNRLVLALRAADLVNCGRIPVWGAVQIGDCRRAVNYGIMYLLA